MDEMENHEMTDPAASPTPIKRKRAEPPDPLNEPHHTIPELAQRWHLSQQTLRRWFEAEPGVCHVRTSRLTKDGIATTKLRIPDSVARRVYRKNMQTK